MYLNLRYKQAMYLKYLKLGTLKVQKVAIHKMRPRWTQADPSSVDGQFSDAIHGF